MPRESLKSHTRLLLLESYLNAAVDLATSSSFARLRVIASRLVGIHPERGDGNPLVDRRAVLGRRGDRSNCG